MVRATSIVYLLLFESLIEDYLLLFESVFYYLTSKEARRTDYNSSLRESQAHTHKKMIKTKEYT